MRGMFGFGSIWGTVILGVFLSGCEGTDGTGGSDGDGCKEPTWLIGTWEGTSSVSGKKLTLVISGTSLVDEQDMVTGKKRISAATGTLTWDGGGANAWSQVFPGEHMSYTNSVELSCLSFMGGQVSQTLSIRVNGTVDSNYPWTAEVDWLAQGSSQERATSMALSGSVSYGEDIRDEFYDEDGTELTLTKR